MDRLPDRDRVHAVLHRALSVGVGLLDAADVYSWGVTREFAAIRAACCARIAAVAAGSLDGRPAPVRAQPRGTVAARGAAAADVERAR